MPEYTPGNIYHCDALTLLGGLEDGSVNLIISDTPYNISKASWDTWPSDDAFLEWLETILAAYRRVLAPNGSLYQFCTTALGARVELVTGKHFNVLNNIRWQKPPYSTKAEMFEKTSLRGFFPASETVIFAEQCGSDHAYNGAVVEGGATYWQALEKAKVSIVGDYLRAEFQRAGVTNRDIARLFPSRTGGMTGCVSNWLLGLNLPTAAQYQTMRDYLCERGDYLRREYEDLRREYEDLRRPFTATETQPYTDVWTYATVNTYPGKHSCEKPYDMMRDIVQISSRPGDLVLDCFVGSGVSLRAARDMGRRWIGGDFDAYWAQKASDALRMPFEARTVKPNDDVRHLPMFAQHEMEADHV